MKIVDLTMLLEEDLPSDPPIQIPKIQRRDHKDTAEEMPAFFPGSTVAEPDYSEQSENFQLAFEIWKTQTPRAEFNASIDASTLRSGILENVVLYVMGDISLDEMAKGAQAVCDEVYK